MSTSRVTAGALGLLLFMAAAPATVAGDAKEAEVGAIAPVDCWPCLGGCGARTGQTATRPLRGPLQEAWVATYGGKQGVVEGAPLVWHNRVVLSVRTDTDKRVLHVLNLHDGSPAARPKTIKSTHPLIPCLWGETVLICTNKNKLEAYRIRKRSLQRYSTFEVEDSVLGTVLHENQAYVVCAGAVLCWQIGSRTRRWRHRGAFRGHPAIRGDDFYAVRYNEGNAHLDVFQRTNGHVGQSLFIGHHGGSTPSTNKPVHIVVHPTNVFVHHGVPVKTSKNEDAGCTWVERTPHPGFPSSIADHSVIDAHHPVALADDIIIGLFRGDDNGLHLLRMEEEKPNKWSRIELADRNAHARLIDKNLGYAVAGRVAHVGGTSFNVDDYEIKWEYGGRILFGPIPARDTILLVDPSHRLIALRRSTGAAADSVLLGPANEPAAAGAIDLSGTLLDHDDEVYDGPLRLAADRLKVSYEERKKNVTRSLSDLRLIVDPQDRVLFTGALDDTARGAGVLYRARNAKAVRKLALDATKSLDADLVESLVDEAAARGVSDASLKSLRKKVAAMRKKNKPAKQEKVAAIRKRLAELTAAEDAAIARVLRSGIADDRPRIRRWFLDAVLSAQPEDEAAKKAVRAMVPSTVEVPDDFDARGWLPLAEALAKTEMTRVAAPKRGQRDLTTQERELGAARSYWREDLVGLKGKELFLIAPLDKPRAIAERLMLANLVTAALEDLFSGLPPARTERPPLTVQFFAERSAFHKVSTMGGSGTGRKSLRGWEVAYHTDSANLTRVTVPEKARDHDWSLRSFATALTYHWMDERCPLFKESEMRFDRTAAGYWTLRGMSEWVREFDWDLEKGTWSRFNRMARSLDMVANAPADKLIPWPIFFATSYRRWLEIPRKPTFRIGMRWVVGYDTIANPDSMFEAQAAATCHYLHHKGGDLRRGLLECLRDVYTGKMGRDSSYIDSRFRVPPDELGARIVNWARDVQSGKVAPPR